MSDENTSLPQRRPRSGYSYTQAPGDELEDHDRRAQEQNDGSPSPSVDFEAREAGQPSLQVQRPSDALSSTTLHYSRFALSIVVPFASLALASWILMAYLTFHPVTSSHSYTNTDGVNYSDLVGGPLDIFDVNERLIQAVNVLLSIVGVLSIPVASATCASAAAIYAQQNKSRDLSIRKVMMLADRCWMNPVTYAPALSPKGWRRNGSTFLAIAIFAHILAFLISPLQQIFLSTASVKRPYSDKSGAIGQLFDIPLQFQKYTEYSNNSVVLAARDSLHGQSPFQPQTQLWHRGNLECDWQDYKCSSRIATFSKISALRDPFLAELPNGHSTGLIRQYLPRINSTAKISETDIPDDCETAPGSLFFHHDHPSTSETIRNSWETTVCMPANARQVPWKPTRSRQDFSEDLYINITTVDRSNLDSYSMKLTVETTAGYFELPNYMNGDKPGPLLEQLPGCDKEAFPLECQFPPDGGEDLQTKLAPNRDSAKGPLQTLALALFGPYSFFSTWPNLGNESTSDSTNQVLSTCRAMSPFGGLFLESGYDADPRYTGTPEFPCGFTTEETADDAIHRFLSDFLESSTGQLENAFTAASFIANKAWMQFGSGPDMHSLMVSYDMGKDTLIPTLSIGGIAAVSAVLFIYLCTLIVIAIYAYRSPRWTNQLDSFAMMRIGSAISQDIPLLAARDASTVQVLDRIPGTMGDATPEDNQRGTLSLGGTSLKGKRRYYSYPNREKIVRKGPLGKESVFWVSNPI